jgi:hypothetical protein
VPSAIGRAVMRGLEKERSKRFPTLAALMHELTPPPQRSPAKFIALAAVGALLATVAAAAVMFPRPDTPLRKDDTEQRIQRLEEEVKKLKDERDQLQGLIFKKDIDLVELSKLRVEVKEKNARIDELLEEATVLRQQAQKGGKPAPPLGVQSREVTDALRQVQRDVEGCFDEWAERAHLEQPKGSGIPVARSASVVVNLAATPDGLAHDVRAKGHESPSVRMCIEHAIARVAFPKGPQNLQLQVHMEWLDGILDMTGHVLGRSEPASTLLDL